MFPPHPYHVPSYFLHAPNPYLFPVHVPTMSPHVFVIFLYILTTFSCPQHLLCLQCSLHVHYVTATSPYTGHIPVATTFLHSVQSVSRLPPLFLHLSCPHLTSATFSFCTLCVPAPAMFLQLLRNLSRPHHIPALHTCPHFRSGVSRTLRWVAHPTRPCVRPLTLLCPLDPPSALRWWEPLRHPWRL